MNTKRILSAATMVALLAFLGSSHAARAYNQETHQELVGLAYEIIRVVELGGTINGVTITNTVPSGATAAEWSAFLADVTAAGPKLRAMTPTAPGLDPGWSPHPIFVGTNPFFDTTGMSIGKWAAVVDNEHDDTHLWSRPTSAGGMGTFKKIVDDALDIGIGVLVAPFVCLVDCLVDMHCGCPWPQDIGDDINPLDDLEGLIPGAGDISNGDVVGMWHHIHMAPWATNQYDDRQGLFLEDAGWLGVPDEFEMAAWVVGNLGGFSINFDKSLGPKRYSITSADDFHPLTDERSKGEWQFTTVAHTPMEPLDNLAFFGWRNFRSSQAANDLGWPLHALGDAAAPHHVIGSFGWGHRPFEDATASMWLDMLFQDEDLDPTTAAREQRKQARRVLEEAFTWWKFIQDWRSFHPGHETDIPVRDMVSQLAQNTFLYSSATMFAAWPFAPHLSASYFAKKTPAIDAYRNFPGAIGLGRPLLESSAAAKLAFLTAAAEVL